MHILQSIATATHNESENMRKLAENGKKDSDQIKALTLIATMYLPASLLAVSDIMSVLSLSAINKLQTIFSSNLIATRDFGGNSGRSYFVVASQFWIYVVLTIGFTFLNIGFLVYLQHRRTWR